MKKTLILIVGLAGIVTLLLWWVREAGFSKRQNHAAVTNDQPHVVSPSADTDMAHRPIPAPPLVFPDDARPAVQKFYEFARVANLYHFNPVVEGLREEPKRFGTDTDLQTSTHTARVINDKIIRVTSRFESANPPHDRSGASSSNWYSCTGTMTEAEAVTVARNILRDIRDLPTLTALEGGRQEFEAIPVRVKDPEGKEQMVTPFRKIRLYDTNGLLRITAEFRMGPTSVAGLTLWSAGR